MSARVSDKPELAHVARERVRPRPDFGAILARFINTVGDRMDDNEEFQQVVNVVITAA